MMNCFCGMVDQRKAFSLIFSRDHCQRSSPSRISDTPRWVFEPEQNLSSGFIDWSCAVVITTTPRRSSGIFERSTRLETCFCEIEFFLNFELCLKYFLKWAPALPRHLAFGQLRPSRLSEPLLSHHISHVNKSLFGLSKIDSINF